jgi:hypothetical protein
MIKMENELEKLKELEKLRSGVQKENQIVWALAAANDVPIRRIYENLESSGANYIASLISSDTRVATLGINSSGYAEYTGISAKHFEREMNNQGIYTPHGIDMFLFPVENTPTSVFIDNKIKEYLQKAQLVIPIRSFETHRFNAALGKYTSLGYLSLGEEEEEKRLRNLKIPEQVKSLREYHMKYNKFETDLAERIHIVPGYVPKEI